jgi:hypothetical protein
MAPMNQNFPSVQFFKKMEPYSPKNPSSGKPLLPKNAFNDAFLKRFFHTQTKSDK